MQNIFYAPNSLFSPESEIIYSKAMERVDLGIKKITIINCAGGASCSINPIGINVLCRLCVKKSDRYFRMFEQYAMENGAQVNRKKICFNNNVSTKIDLCSDIKSTVYEGSDIGYATLSTYIGFTRDYEPDIERRGSEYVLAKLLHSAIAVHEWFSEFCKEINEFDEFFLFNGRLNNTRPALRMIVSKGLNCTCLELAGRSDRLVDYKNVLPHDICANLKIINSLFLRHAADAVGIADEFYSSKMNGGAINDKSYIGAQVASKLPEGFDSNCINIAIFGSSEDELKAIGKEWDLGIYPDQIHAVRQLAILLGGLPKFKLYYRVHPNVKTTPRKYKNKIDSLSSENVTVIGAESDISSYALMMNSNIVVTFGSTMGVEASYWGKPSVLIGKSFYQDVGATYNPKDESEIVAMLTTDLRALPKDGAYKMAIFYTQNGYKTPHFCGGGNAGYFIAGRKVELSRFEKIAYVVCKVVEKMFIKIFVR